MQKTALFLLPVAALAILVLVFVLMKRREPDGGMAGPVGILKKGASPDRTSGDSAQLRAELERLQKENDAIRRRAEEAEARVARLESESEIPAEPKKADAKPGDWKKRRDAELEAKIKAVDWRKRIKGLIDYWHEMEKSRQDGRPPKMNAETMEQLMKLTAEAVDFAKYLGLDGKNPYKAFSNELLGAAWMDAFLQEVSGGTLTEDQLRQLRGTDLYKDDDGLDDPNRNRLETWRELIEHNRSFGTATAGILTPDQHAQVLSAVSPPFMLSVYAEYAEKPIASGAEAPQAVASFWIKSFEIPDAQRAAVEAVAADFTKQLSSLAQAYATQYGATLPRDADFEMRLKALDLQIAAEKKLAESLALEADQLKKFLKGSGSVIKLTN